MLIIYLSGIDGCGKTTQAKLLAEALASKGLNVEYMWFRWEPSLRKQIEVFRSLYTKRPKNSVTSGLVENENAEQGAWLNLKRKILGNSIIKGLWLFYSCLDYYYAYLKLFRKNMPEILIMDRYIHDFIIDQSINLNISVDQNEIVSNNFFLKKFHYPDFNIIIDLPAEEGYLRKSDGTSLNYLENREKYYKAISGNNTFHLDGLQSIDNVASIIRTWVFKKLEVKS
ncbi:dTMP kinase [Desulforhopalus sp. 52FAK]